jgi:hypothetical protein
MSYEPRFTDANFDLCNTGATVVSVGGITGHIVEETAGEVELNKKMDMRESSAKEADILGTSSTTR